MKTALEALQPLLTTINVEIEAARQHVAEMEKIGDEQSGTIADCLRDQIGALERVKTVARQSVDPELAGALGATVDLDGAMPTELPTDEATAEYLNRFPPEARVYCDRAYQDGHVDALNSLKFRELEWDDDGNWDGRECTADSVVGLFHIVSVLGKPDLVRLLLNYQSEGNMYQTELAVDLTVEEARSKAQSHLETTMRDVICGCVITAEQRPQDAADGWIEWDGNVNTRPRKKIVDVRYRDGREFQGEAGDGFLWHHDGAGDDIVAYRVVRDVR